MIKDKVLIGIHGKAGAGKDTLANVIHAMYPRKFKSNSFARPLKEGVKSMFGWDTHRIEDRRLKEEVDPFWGFSPRKAMQLLGTEYGRKGLCDDVWIKAAEHYYQQCLESDQGVIMTDVRFENEATWIRSKEKSIIIHVVDPFEPYVDPEMLHPSERGIRFNPETDYLLSNDKTKGIDNLYHILGGGTFWVKSEE